MEIACECVCVCGCVCGCVGVWRVEERQREEIKEEICGGEIMGRRSTHDSSMSIFNKLPLLSTFYFPLALSLSSLLYELSHTGALTLFHPFSFLQHSWHIHFREIQKLVQGELKMGKFFSSRKSYRHEIALCWIFQLETLPFRHLPTKPSTCYTASLQITISNLIITFEYKCKSQE